ncbi:hypothetical protein [Kaistella solincola]|nr:hypothetical protein [Kaistella solincola]
MPKLLQENFVLMKIFLEMRELRPGWNGLFELFFGGGCAAAKKSE